MKVNSNRDISFKSFYTNSAVRKSLEFAADNGALFASTATVGFSMLRPLSIWLTPDTDKENRQLAIYKSIASSLIGFGLTLALSIPLSKAIKKIDKNPAQFLKSSTIKFLKEQNKPVEESKAYTLATQTFKLGLGALVAIPKSIMVASGIPILMNTFSNKNTENGKLLKYSKTPTFCARKGGKISECVAKILDAKKYQNFSEKYKDSNFPMHMTALTDIVATGTFVHQTLNSKKIAENRKKTLAYNSLIGTTLSVISGYILDKLLENPTEKFILKYKKLNKNQENLLKQILGIRIIKPILVLGSVYYMLIPFISTFLAERAGTKNISVKQ